MAVDRYGGRGFLLCPHVSAARDLREFRRFKLRLTQGHGSPMR
jgi:hypothetical protein